MDKQAAVKPVQSRAELLRQGLFLLCVAGLELFVPLLGRRGPFFDWICLASAPAFAVFGAYSLLRTTKIGSDLADELDKMIGAALNIFGRTLWRLIRIGFWCGLAVLAWKMYEAADVKALLAVIIVFLAFLAF
jgi:hypothetical protein